MADLQPEINSHYDQEIEQRMVEKHGFDPLVAFEAHLQPETYRMFNNPDLDMLEFSPQDISDMRKNEQVAGVPHNLPYLRRGAIV